MEIAEGKIKQYQGPFNPNDIIVFDSDIGYKIGISIGEDDYMSFPNINREQFESIPIVINGEQIQIGKTYMYEPGFLMQREGNSFSLSFPKGCPASTLIEITTLQKPIE